MVRLRAKAFLEGRGTQYRSGAEFECSEEEAARLVSIGAADSVVDPDQEVPAREAAVKNEPVDLPDYDDVTRGEILAMLGQKIEIDGQLKRATKKVLYQKLIEVWE